MLLTEALDARKHKVITLVGGGGKTSTMYRLARELSETGAKVLVTTTTRINMPTAEEADLTIVSRDSTELVSKLRDSLATHRVVGLGFEIVDVGKLKGIPPEWVADLAHLADHVIVEADGSAGRPFKAPADHEPVIPGCTDLLVAVVGVETVGLPLARENVHRPERVQAITGLEPGQLITSAIVARVLLHPSGIAKGTPSGARTVVLVNKVEDDAQLGTARAIGRLLLAGGVGRVVIGQVRNDPPVVEIMP